MRTIPSSVAPDVYTDLMRGERDALRRLFEEYAPALVESADSALHAEVASAHVVEHLFESTWHKRDDFTSPEALHDWLTTETPAMAHREQARRAGLRHFDGHQQVQHAAPATPLGGYDVAAGWARVVHRIEAIDADPETGAALRHAASRHGAAEHIAHVGEGVNRKMILGGAALLLALFTVFYFGMERAGADFKVTQALADKEAHAITTAVGERASVKLDDGTQVMLGADASIIVPKQFNRELRALKLRGSARFSVASNPKLPFDVRAGKMTIVATGTTFTVSEGDGGPVVVSVQEGTVQVTAGEVTRDLTSGSSLMLSADGALSEPTTEQRDEATAWADGYLVIVNRPLRDALSVLRRWYKLDMRPQVTLLDRTISMRSRLGFEDSAIVALELAGNVKQTWAGKQMLLVDKAAVPAPARKAK